MNLGTPEIFADAQIKVMGEGHAYPMISYKPLQVSSAFKLYAKSQGLDFEISNEITSQIKEYEKACEVIAETVFAETQKQDLEVVANYQKWITEESNVPADKKSAISKSLDALQNKMKKTVS